MDFDRAHPPKDALIVVGTGRWGRNHAMTAHKLDILTAIVDPSEKAIEALLAKSPALSSIPRYTTLTQALESHPSGNVVIATPPSTHYALARQALLADRHILVEKPVCDSLEHARELVDLARQRDRRFMVDHLLHYSAPHRRLITLARSGRIGRITRVKMTRINFGTVRTEENVLWSFCPHDISVLLAIAGGAPTHVSCRGQAVVSSGIEDYVELSLQLPGDVQASVEASWLHPGKERRAIVYGTEGCLVLNEGMPDSSLPQLQMFKWSAKRAPDGGSVDASKREVNLADGSGEDAEPFTSEKEPLRAALQHFQDCIQTGKAPRTDGEEGVRVLQVLTDASRDLGTSTGTDIAMSRPTPEPQRATAAAANGSSPFFAHETAVIDAGAQIGDGSKIWHFCHVMPGAVLGARCNIGQNVFIGGRARLGVGVRVQNNVSVYDAVELEDEVFVGPSCVFTNIRTPRSHVSRKNEFVATKVGRRAMIGANATVVCGVVIGAYAFVGAGAVVTKDVAPHALVYGNPARVQGWVSTTGVRLVETGRDGETVSLKCPESGETYQLDEAASQLTPS